MLWCHFGLPSYDACDLQSFKNCPHVLVPAGHIPRHGERGVNAGVLMASLEAVRASNFTAERDAIIGHYSPLGKLQLGDQDILNIYGHSVPDQIYVMPCVFNFRCPLFPIPSLSKLGLGDLLANSTDRFASEASAL